MDTGIGEDSSPKSNHLEGWRKAIANGHLASFKLEEIAAAFQVLRGRDKQVQNALADYLSLSILRILRRRVGSNHPNRGEDIILRAHHQIIVALLRPNTADGRGLREAFVARVEYRLKDAIAVENRERRVPDENSQSKSADNAQEQDEVVIEQLHAVADDELAGGEFEKILVKQPCQPTPHDGSYDLDQNLDVRCILERIADPRKRLAFYLYMNDVPYHSKKTGVTSIALALNISDKTARAWVEEVRQELTTNENVQYLKKEK
jgi:hypothetical protein